MINPLLYLDYPDPDVIRVDNTFYMVSTTMHFMPGCEILRSYDLVHWEHAAFVYERLDSTAGQTLEDGVGIYGKGMWAASFRYHDGIFYIAFVCNDTHKTYLYTSPSIKGPWQKHNISGFYHDCSLLFDDDGRVYIAYGNRQIHITELKEDLTGPKEGGLDRIAVTDCPQTPLGYEGTHFYKIDGKYYLFFIHSLPERWMRTEDCFVADSLDAEFTGYEVCNTDMGYCGSGVAQGAIVDTPDGRWYSILFQDRGAVGRIPVLIPVTFENGVFSFGVDKSIPCEFETPNLKPGYEYAPLASSDDFRTNDGESFGLKSFWQYNHEPNLEYTAIDINKGTFSITTDRVCREMIYASNTITQRLFGPRCHVEVTVDATGLNCGDYAGLAVLQGAYAFAGIKKEEDGYYLVMIEKITADGQMMSYNYELIEREKIKTDNPVCTFSFDADFDRMKDEVRFNIGPVHKMYFKLDQFVGNRAALFAFSTLRSGGSAVFSNFVLEGQPGRED